MPGPQMNVLAGAAPDLYQQQLALQQQQELAKGLMQQGAQPLDPMRSSGRYIVPISPLEGLTHAGKSLAAAMMQKNINQQQGDLAGKQMQAVVAALRQAQGGQAPAGAPQQNPMAPDAATPSVMAGSGSTTPPAASPQPAAPQQPQGGGDDISKYLALGLIGNTFGTDAAQLAGKQFAPSDTASLAKEAGYAPGSPQFQAAANQKLFPPQVPRGFPIQTINPQTGQYGADPSSVTSLLNFERDKLGVTEPFKLTSAQGAGGGQVPTFNYQLPGYPGPRPAGAPAPTATASVSPRASPSGPQSAPRLQAGDPWSTMPKRAEPQGVGETTYYRETAAKAAEAAHKLAEKYGATAQTANERKSFNAQALEMLPQATTGPGALAITELQTGLNARFGIPLEMMQKASAGDAAATQELNKNLLNAATKTAKANYGARMTQSEVMMQIKQGSPNVDMTRAAITYLLKADNARADYEMKQASDVGRYLSQGGDPYQFEGWYSRAFPMSGAVRAGTGTGLQLSPQTADFMRRNGIQLPQ